MNYKLEKLKTCRYLYWGTFLFLGFLVLIGLASSAYMEHEGHYVTGMNNQIVWGLPHIFAVTLIVIASGVLNIASMSSAFNKKLYKPLAPLSALFAIAFLIAGLIILVLDLGRPDRLIVAMTTYNFKSIFAWNIFLYSGFFVILSIYIWTMLDFNVSRFSSTVGKLAFGWRIILTTGTGSIFGFLVAREAYSTAVLAPLFIIMSLLYGTAVFYILLRIISKMQNITIPTEITVNIRKLIIIFLLANIYFLILYHITNLYISKQIAIEKFILLDGGGYTTMFWLGQVGLGLLIPLIYELSNKESRNFPLILTSIMIIVGGFFAVAVIIIGGQAFPLNIFPDHTIIESTFFDNGIHGYTPSIYEYGLGIGGTSLALIIILVLITNLKFIPSKK
ncbi:MAG: polysulfide reductase NrfD [Gammaproteobacteria bacterium]|jgi:molybdopterin-containing oxidoreductase family membrane subunit|nr:polysulfide reductase NrfD [Gammaproteobacteria bacterium]